MKAIPTTYRGNTFRSRLEARWAAFFDIIEWRWTYEPFDTNGYIPDFLIHGIEPLLIEIKPAATPSDYQLPISKIEKGLTDHWKHDYLILGSSPIAPLSSNFDLPAAGILGEYMGCHRYEIEAIEEYSWDPASGLWHQCSMCWKLNVSHDYQSFKSRPCGHYDGGNNLSDPPRGVQGIEEIWATAGNLTQWKSSNLAPNRI